MSLARTSLLARRLPALVHSQVMSYSDGDKAGAIKEAGGAFAKREAAQEDQYFRKLQTEQLKKLKGHVDDEIKHHKEEIERHQEAINRLKAKSKELEKWER